MLREGDGEAHPLKDTQCSCHYEGRTAQEYSKEPKGKKFDSSYDRGSPTSFAPSGVIAGWTVRALHLLLSAPWSASVRGAPLTGMCDCWWRAQEAMQLMVEGDKWEMYIPSELGYGDSGQGGDIGAGDVLVFTMELISIEGPSTPAEPKGPPPYAELLDTDLLDAWAETNRHAAPTLVLAALYQPTRPSKLFQAFKALARDSAKAGDPTQFALAANSKFMGGRYTPDPVVTNLKLSQQSIYVLAAGWGEHGDFVGGWQKCKTGRPSEVTVEQIKTTLAECIGRGSAAAKDEL